MRPVWDVSLTHNQLQPRIPFPFPWKQDWQLQDFLLLLHRAKLQGALIFPLFPAPVINLVPEAQFSSLLDSYQNKPRKACHFLYNLRRIIIAAANYSGTQIQFLKTTHSSLQEKPNDYFFFPKQILVSRDPEAYFI